MKKQKIHKRKIQIVTVSHDVSCFHIYENKKFGGSTIC